MSRRSVMNIKNLNKNQISEGVTLYNSGVSYEAIAKQFNVSGEAFRKLLIKNGVQMRAPKKKRELLGEIFGKLIVAAYYHPKFIKKNGDRRTQWICFCQCGNICIVQTERLVGGRTASCGCKTTEKRFYKNNWERAATKIWKKDYRESGLLFEDFCILSKQNCFYCGIEPSKTYYPALKDPRASKEAKENHKYTYNGLDRLDNDYGHTLENCVPCCTICNLMKGTMNKKQFFEHILNTYNTKFLSILRPIITTKLKERIILSIEDRKV